MDYINLYPTEIVENIFKYIPDDVLIKFSSCSKYYKEIFKNVSKDKNKYTMYDNFDIIFKDRRNLLLLPNLFKDDNIDINSLIECGIKYGYYPLMNMVVKSDNRDMLENNFSRYMFLAIKNGHILLVKFLYENIYENLYNKCDKLSSIWSRVISMKFMRKKCVRALNYLVEKTYMDIYPSKVRPLVDGGLVTSEIALTDYCVHINDLSLLLNGKRKYKLEYVSAFALLNSRLDIFFKYLPYSSYYKFIYVICDARNKFLYSRLVQDHGVKKVGRVFRKLAGRFGKQRALYLSLDIFKNCYESNIYVLQVILDNINMSQYCLMSVIKSCHYKIKEQMFVYYVNKFADGLNIQFVKENSDLLGKPNYNNKLICEKLPNRVLINAICKGYNINVEESRMYSIFNRMDKMVIDMVKIGMNVEYNKTLLNWVIYHCPLDSKNKYIEKISINMK